MLSYSWALWATQIFLMLIIYLNFLIAIISDSYQAVMKEVIIRQYAAKCQVIFEITLAVHYFDKIFWPMHNYYATVFTLVCRENYTTIDKNVDAIVAPLQADIKGAMNTLQGEVMEVKEEVDKIDGKLAEMKKEVVDVKKQVVTDVKKEIKNAKKEVEAMKKEVIKQTKSHLDGKIDQLQKTLLQAIAS